MTTTSKDKIIKKLIKMINDDSKEVRPTVSDKRWKKVNNNVYTIKSNNSGYKVTQKLVDYVEKYTDMYIKIHDVEMYDILKKYNDNIGIIYLLTDRVTNFKYVGFTTNSLLTFIKLNLHKYNLKEKNVFEKVNSNNNNNNNNLTDLEFRLLEFVKYKDKADIISRKDTYQDILDNSETVKETTTSDKQTTIINNNNINNSEFFDRRMDVFYDIFDNFKNSFKEFQGFIYVIKNKLNNKKFIGGVEKEMTKSQFINTVVKFNSSQEFMDDLKKNGPEGFIYGLLEKYKADSFFDFMLRVDYFKITLKSLDQYNTSFNMDESEKLFKKDFPTRAKMQVQKNFFIKIQKLLFLKNIKDSLDYTNTYGFVYMIENKKNSMKYIGYALNTTLKNAVSELYDKALKDNIKHNKILRVLMEEPYDRFRFKILKVKTMTDTSVDLKGDVSKYIAKYDTIKKGYNIDYNDLKNKIIIGQHYGKMK